MGSVTTLRPVAVPICSFCTGCKKAKFFHPLAVWGFRLTLLFVVITIIAAVVALRCCDAELVEIDALHGGAEAFLTLGNAVLVAGLWQQQQQKGE